MIDDDDDDDDLGIPQSGIMEVKLQVAYAENTQLLTFLSFSAGVG